MQNRTVWNLDTVRRNIPRMVKDLREYAGPDTGAVCSQGRCDFLNSKPLGEQAGQTVAGCYAANSGIAK